MKFRNLLFIILAIGFLIRISYGIYAYQRNVMQDFSDDIHYVNYAEQIIKQGPLALDVTKITEDFVGPVLPMILSLVLLCFGNNWINIFLLNAVVSTLTILVVYLIAAKIFDKKVGLLSALIATPYVLYIHSIPTAGKDVWLIFLFCASLWRFLLYLDHPGKYNTALLAVVLTLLIHLDERFLLFILLYLLWILISTKRKFNIRVVHSLKVGMLVLILSIPWLIRNYIAYERVVILTTRTEYFTNRIWDNGSGKDNIIDSKLSKFYLSEAQIAEVREDQRDRYASGKKITPAVINAIKNGITPGQQSWVKRKLTSFRIMWQPFDFWDEFVADGYKFHPKWSPSHNISVFFTYGIILVLGIWGLFSWRKKKDVIFFLIIAILLLQIIIQVFLTPFVSDRYRTSIDFILIIMAAYTMSCLFTNWNYKSHLHK